jgi:hypothetical protein
VVTSVGEVRLVDIDIEVKERHHGDTGSQIGSLYHGVALLVENESTVDADVERKLNENAVNLNSETGLLGGVIAGIVLDYILYKRNIERKWED